MQDKTLTRVDKTLTSATVVIQAAAREAERLRDQTLADDIHEVLVALKRITGGIGTRGQSYRPK